MEIPGVHTLEVYSTSSWIQNLFSAFLVKQEEISRTGLINDLYSGLFKREGWHKGTIIT